MSTTSSKHITLKDIAGALSLSPSTVSRALQDHPDISESTKALVRKFAAENRYRPNALAHSLRTKKTNNTVGIVIPELGHHFFASVISGIEEVAYKEGYNVMICQTNEDYRREIINV